MKKGALFTTIGSVVILIISFIAFVLPSTLGSSKPKEADVLGKYNGREIRYERDSQFSANLQQSQNFQQALQDTVRDFAFEDMAKQSGYIVPNQTVNYYIRKQFTDSDGKFSKSKFRMADASVIDSLTKSLTQGLYTQVVSEDLIPPSSNPYAASTATDIYKGKPVFGNKTSDAEMEFYTNFETEQRGFDLVVFNKADLPVEEIAKWVVPNKAKFDTFDYSLVTFESESTATKYADKLEKGQITFDELLLSKDNKKVSVTSEGKGSFVLRYKLELRLDDKADIAIFDDLPVGKTSKPFKFYDHWAIIKKDSETKPIDVSLKNEEELNIVKDYMYSYEMLYIEDYFVARAKEFKQDAAATSFDKACAKHDIKKTIIPAFPLNYGSVSMFDTLDTSITGLSQAATNEEFLKTAFTLKLNEISDPIISGDSQSYGFVLVIQYTNNKNTEASEDDDPEFEAKLRQMMLASYDNQSIIVDIMNDEKTDIPDNYFGNYF